MGSSQRIRRQPASAEDQHPGLEAATIVQPRAAQRLSEPELEHGSSSCQSKLVTICDWYELTRE